MILNEGLGVRVRFKVSPSLRVRVRVRVNPYYTSEGSNVFRTSVKVWISARVQ